MSQESSRTDDSQNSQDLDKASREKLNTALNYYFYSIGSNKDVCNNFNLLKGDDYIKDHVDNIEILSCLYNSDSPNDLVKDILRDLKVSPDTIIKILNQDREAGLKQNEQKVKDATDKYEREEKQLNSELQNTKDQIAEAKKGLAELKKSIAVLEAKKRELEGKINKNEKDHENMVVTIEQDNISIKEENNKGYENLRNYEDVGHSLNQLSIQLTKLESNRKKSSGKKYTLNPKRTCTGEYHVDKNDKSKCLCLTDNGGLEVCDPHNCKDMPGFKYHQKCKKNKKKS